MENYELFMIAERQNRIENNNFEIKKLKDEVEILKPKYKKYRSQMSFLANEYNDLQNQLKNLEEEYQKHKDTKTLYYKSERIQTLSEKITEQTEKIEFANCLNEGNQAKKYIPVSIKSFINFYKYKKQLIQDEIHENLSFFFVLYEYLKYYYIFKCDKKYILESNNNISELLFKYEFEKKNMINEVEKLSSELEDRRNFLWSYEKKKSVLKSLIQDILNEIMQMTNSQDFIDYKQKTQKISELDVQNQNYQAQIENMLEISGIKIYRKYRKSA